MSRSCSPCAFGAAARARCSMWTATSAPISNTSRNIRAPPLSTYDFAFTTPSRHREPVMTDKHIRLGVFAPPHHPNNENPTLAMQRDFQLVEWLEELGYSEFWLGEHHSGGMQIYGSPALFIAAAAERTTRIKLGAAVISLPYHNPLMVADRIVQLDHQTRGRAMFGFGPGALSSDAHMLDIPVASSRDRLNQAVHTIVRLLDGEVVTEKTDWYSLKDARVHLEPYTRPRPHLAVASLKTPTGAIMAGTYNMGLLCAMAGSVGS